MNIDRKTAEACRERARILENRRETRSGYLPIREDVERRECVAVWNEFCAQEQERLDAAKRGTPAAALLAGKSVHRR